MATFDRERKKAIAATAERAELERRLAEAIKEAIARVFEQLCALGYGAHLIGAMFRWSRLKDTKRLQEILDRLRETLYDLIAEESQQAVDIVERNYAPFTPLLIATFLNRESGGKTPRQRIAIYVNRLKMEMESWVASGLVLGMSQRELVRAFRRHITKPYANPVFAAARQAEPAATARRLRDGGVSYGVGRYVSAAASLTRLGRYMAADSYRLAQFLTFGSTPGVVGYWVGRGSSYPCELCDSMVGLHQKGFDELPPYHGHCVCWAMPVTQQMVADPAFSFGSPRATP